MKRCYSMAIMLIMLIAGFNCSVNAQFKNYPLKFGLNFSALDPYTEFYESRGLKWSTYSRGFLRFELLDKVEGELGGGYMHVAGLDRFHKYYSSNVYPVDFRFIYNPFEFETWNPYISAGLGLMYWIVKHNPSEISPLPVKYDGYSGILPLTAGAEFKLTQQLFLNLNLGYTHSLTSSINLYKSEDGFFKNDGVFNLGAGLTFAINPVSKDKDFDGLTNSDEEKLGTDPENPDSDGDNLKDGEEAATYKTDPMKADTDNDGLNDNEELTRYKTDPLLADTDGDKLTDGDELLKYKTNPLMIDTDGDKLADGEEVLSFNTSPLNIDTDKDGLNDFVEIMKYKSNPLWADTDGGGKSDGDEAKAGTNLLNKDDDVEKPAVVQTPTEPVKEEVFNLKGILFASNSSAITAQSELILEKNLEYLLKHTDVKIQVNGHTDSMGDLSYNMKLSEKRAAEVKNWLMKKGIGEERILTKGFGPNEPAAPNNNSDGRMKNRRAEFKKAGI